MTDRASPEARSRIEEIAKNAIELADVQELEELAFSLEVNERYQIDSLEDYDHIIDELERSGSDDVEQARGPSAPGRASYRSKDPSAASTRTARPGRPHLGRGSRAAAEAARLRGTGPSPRRR